MSLQSETYRLDEERARLDEQLDDLADKLADADQGSASGQALRQTANEVETQLGGVTYLIDEFGPDAEVTVAALDAGLYARVQDRLASMRAQRTGGGDIPGARRNVFAAAGLETAPFLDAEGEATLDAKIETVSAQPIGVATWLEGRVNELSTMGEGDFRRLSERLAAKEDS